MSNDGQESDWAEFTPGARNVLKSNSGHLLIPDDGISASLSYLIPWADSCEDLCSKVLNFEPDRTSQMLSNIFKTARERHWEKIPPLMWGSLNSALEKAQNLWRCSCEFHLGWIKTRQDWYPSLHKGMSTTAQELYTIFSYWSDINADDLSGTGDSVWEKVLEEISLGHEKLERIRFNSQSEYLPFFRWEAEYQVTEQGRPIVIASTEIAAWFVLFSLRRVYLLFISLASRLNSNAAHRNDEDLGELGELFEYWVDIQQGISVAQYWYDRIYSLGETLQEFEKRIASEAQNLTLAELKLPNVPVNAVGRIRLYNWFEKPSSTPADFVQWQAYWMATTGQLEPSDSVELSSEDTRAVMTELKAPFNTAVMKLAFDKAVAKFREVNRLEKKWLEILERRHTNATKDDLKRVVLHLIGNHGESMTSMDRAFKAVAAYRDQQKNAKKEFTDRLRDNIAKVKKSF